MMDKLQDFFERQIWQITEVEVSDGKKLTLKMVKILLLAIQGFQRDLCTLRASALTLYCLLSIVPVIAMLFGIAKGFGFEKVLKQHLLEQQPEQDGMIQRVIAFAENLLANTEGGLIAGIGVVMLFWSVIKVISTIEESFNQIWKIKKGRSLARKLSDYLSLMLLAPVLLMIAGSISVFVATQITGLIQASHLPAFSALFVVFVLKLSPLLIMSGLFSFMLVFLPNQKVNVSAGLIAGMVTGVLYQTVQWLYLNLQIGVSNYNAIYGSFAALPLFLIWLQTGWFIVLLGCQLCFFIQHYSNYQYKPHFDELSFAAKKIMAVQISCLLVQQFLHYEQAVNSQYIASKLQLPLGWVQTLLRLLAQTGIVAAIQSDDGELFLPAKDIHQLTAYNVIAALENQGYQLPGLFEQNFAGSINLTRQLEDKLKTSPENILLTELSETFAK